MQAVNNMDDVNDYRDVSEKPINRDEVEKLYVGGRQVDANVIEYLGLWLPA